MINKTIPNLNSSGEHADAVARQSCDLAKAGCSITRASQPDPLQHKDPRSTDDAAG